MGNWSVLGWYCTSNVECLTHTQKCLILLAFDGYEAVCLWWQGGSGRAVSFEKTAIFVRFRPAPPNTTLGFESFDIIESDSSFHRAKLAQGDKGIDSGQ